MSESYTAESNTENSINILMERDEAENGPSPDTGVTKKTESSLDLEEKVASTKTLEELRDLVVRDNISAKGSKKEFTSQDIADFINHLIDKPSSVSLIDMTRTHGLRNQIEKLYVKKLAAKNITTTEPPVFPTEEQNPMDKVHIFKPGELDSQRS